jgi:hypothetical protein
MPLLRLSKYIFFKGLLQKTRGTKGLLWPKLGLNVPRPNMLNPYANR